MPTGLPPMKHILIEDALQLKQMMVFAEHVGAQDELAKRLYQLLRLCCMAVQKPYEGDEWQRLQPSDNNNVAVIGKDFAPLSFRWAILRGTYARLQGDPSDRSCIYNGGFIYSGPSVRSDGSFPSLTVSLDDLHRKPGEPIPHTWSIHT